MKDVYVSIATYPKRFRTIIDTLKSLTKQTYTNFHVEIHIYQGLLDNNISGFPELRKFCNNDSRFSIVPCSRDIGPYKKWLSCKLHPDAYIMTGSDRVIYNSNFLETHIVALNRNPNIVYNGATYCSYVNKDLIGMSYVVPKSMKNKPGFYDIGFGSTFDSKLISKTWFDLDFAFDTGVLNDDKFFHFVLASHGIKNVGINPMRAKHIEFNDRLGKSPDAYKWNKLFYKLKHEKKELFRAYQDNIRHMIDSYDLVNQYGVSECLIF